MAENSHSVENRIRDIPGTMGQLWDWGNWGTLLVTQYGGGGGGGQDIFSY